jgi:GAF domain-containing protein
VSAARIRELERLLEESERERSSLLDAVRDTLHLQRMAEEAGTSSEPSPLLLSFVKALGRIVPWTAAEVRLRDGAGDRKFTRTALREGCERDLEAEIRELEEEGVLEWALETVKPTSLPSLGDRQGPGWLLVPLVAQGADIGFALLRTIPPPDSLTDHHLEMIRLLASLTAVALDNIATSAKSGRATWNCAASTTWPRRWGGAWTPRTCSTPSWVRFGSGWIPPSWRWGSSGPTASPCG